MPTIKELNQRFERGEGSLSVEFVAKDVLIARFE